MKNVTIAVSLLSLALASCGSDGDTASQTADATASADGEMAMGGPYSEAETRMNEAMMAAVGVNVGDSWVRKMIAHHRGAIEMSNLVLAQNPSADVATMARGVIAKQTAEIADLEKLVTGGNPDAASAEPFRAAATTMHQAMMAAEGADVSETYLRKMLAHHTGAIAMSDAVLAQQGVSPAIRARAEKVRIDQQQEIAMAESMLRGEPMNSAKAMPTAAVSPEPNARPVARATATPRPTATPKPAPKPKLPAPGPSPSDPHAGMDM